MKQESRWLLAIITMSTPKNPQAVPNLCLIRRLSTGVIGWRFQASKKAHLVSKSFLILSFTTNVQLAASFKKEVADICNCSPPPQPPLPTTTTTYTSDIPKHYTMKDLFVLFVLSFPIPLPIPFLSTSQPSRVSTITPPPTQTSLTTDHHHHFILKCLSTSLEPAQDVDRFHSTIQHQYKPLQPLPLQLLQPLTCMPAALSRTHMHSTLDV